MELIDKDALVAEIEKLQSEIAEEKKLHEDNSMWYNGINHGFNLTKDILNTIEVKEMDNIWHDANIELPRKDKEVLALVIRPNLRAYVAFPSGHGTLYSLFGIIDINDVSKWCYIENVLKL